MFIVGGGTTIRDSEGSVSVMHELILICNFIIEGFRIFFLSALSFRFFAPIRGTQSSPNLIPKRISIIKIVSGGNDLCEVLIYCGIPTELSPPRALLLIGDARKILYLVFPFFSCFIYKRCRINKIPILIFKLVELKYEIDFTIYDNYSNWRNLFHSRSAIWMKVF